MANTRKYLDELLTKEPETHREMVYYRFGLNEESQGIPRDINEVSRKYGIAPERFRQIETKLMRNILLKIKKEVKI